MSDETSVTASVTPAETTPETGTSTTQAASMPSVTPDTKASDDSVTSIEDAKRRIAELEKLAANKSDEASRHYKNLAKYQEAEKKQQEAALSEVERATKRANDAEAKILSYQKQLVSTKVQMAAQNKGIIDPELAAMALEKTLEYDDSGMPTNLDKALDALIKSKPYLAPSKVAATEETKPTAQTAPTHTTPAIPAQNPGRSSYAPASDATKSQPITLGQFYAEHGSH